MKVEFTENFLKLYKKRFSHHPSMQKKFQERTSLFTKDPLNPILHDHALAGLPRGRRAFWVAGDIRVIYYIQDGTAYFIDIGSHNQVY